MLKILLIIQILSCALLNAGEDLLKNDYKDLREIYLESGLNSSLSFDVFVAAMTGMEEIGGIRNKNIITIIDYSKPSSQERFFVIDLVKKKILYKTLVAHGKNSGEEKAESFSNTSESQKSCLGFFLTAETYKGKHGYSLCIDGIEPGINDNARKRSIVIHGADYVSKDFMEKYGRLGRSWGCPALPVEVSGEIIDLIAGGSCLFIYADDQDYFKYSKINTSK